MESFRFRFIALFLIILLFSCGELSPLVFTPEDFLGKWNALKDEFTKKNNRIEKVNILTETNTDSITLTFSENSLTHETFFTNGDFALSVYGYEVMGDTLGVSTFDGDMIYKFVYERAIVGNVAINVLRLTNEDTTYDFDNDGTEQAAIEVIELERL